MKALWQAFSSDESGQGLVEYALIIALLSAACVAAQTAFVTSVTEMFARLEQTLL